MNLLSFFANLFFETVGETENDYSIQDDLEKAARKVDGNADFGEVEDDLVRMSKQSFNSSDARDNSSGYDSMRSNAGYDNTQNENNS